MILGLLMLAPMSLYDLHKQFEAGPSLFYSASHGSIQRALRGLVEAELVTATDDADSARRRRIHTVTAAGVEHWRQWMSEPLSGANAETEMLAKVFLLGLLPAGPDRDGVPSVLRASVESSRGDLVTLEESLDQLDVPFDLQDVFRFQRATLDDGLRSHDLALHWLGELARPSDADRPTGAS